MAESLADRRTTRSCANEALNGLVGSNRVPSLYRAALQFESGHLRAAASQGARHLPQFVAAIHRDKERVHTHMGIMTSVPHHIFMRIGLVAFKQAVDPDLGAVGSLLVRMISHRRTALAVKSPYA